MRFNYKTIILGGARSGVLSLQVCADGSIKGKLSTLKGDQNLFLVLFDAEKSVVIESERFNEFDLYGFNENNINAFLILDEKIIAHGKTAFGRVSDSKVLETIRSYRNERKAQKTRAQNLFSPVSEQTAKSEETQKPKITDYFLNIEYDDDAVAQVNYFEQKENFSPLSPFIRDSEGQEVEVASTLSNDRDFKQEEPKKEVFSFSDSQKVYPYAYERGFLRRDYFVESKNQTLGKALPRSRKITTRKRNSLSQKGGQSYAQTHKEDGDNSENRIPVMQKTPKPTQQESIPTIQADFFEEVSGQIDALMEKYPREEELQKVIPESRWVKIALDNGDYYVLGIVSHLYIIYGVPGKKEAPPAELKGAIFIPVDEKKGYWCLIQDASTGKSISPIPNEE